MSYIWLDLTVYISINSGCCMIPWSTWEVWEITRSHVKKLEFECRISPSLNLKTRGTDITFIVDLFIYMQIKLLMFYVSFKWLHHLWEIVFHMASFYIIAGSTLNNDLCSRKQRWVVFSSRLNLFCTWKLVVFRWRTTGNSLHIWSFYMCANWGDSVTIIQMRV